MNDGFYDRLIATASALIQKRGRPIEIWHILDGATPDPTKPWDKATPTPPIKVPTFGVFTGFDRQAIDGVNIKATDLKLIFVALPLTFDLSSRDIINDSKYGQTNILDVQSVEPGTQKVLYTCQVRRG